MRAMKDSGIEWIGQIPQEWRLERLKYHADFNPATELPALADEDDVSFVPMDHLKAGFHTQSIVPYSKVKKGYVCFADGDVLMAKVTPCLENGNLAIAENLREGFGFGSTEINVMRCNTIANRFLFYLLQCPTYIEKAKYNMYGVAGLKRLDPDFIPNSYFPVPTDDEQLRIVSYVDKKCAEIDALIVAKEKTNALLKERRQSIIYEAVTKGLNPDTPMKDSGIEWIGQIPEGWSTVRVKYTGSYKSGNTITAADIKESGNFPVYGGNGLRGYTDEITHDGDHLLIGRQGALCGNVHMVSGKFWASEHAVVGTINANYAIRFLFYVLDVFDLNRLSTSAAQPGISVEQITGVVISCPTFVEQQEIANMLDANCAEVDELISANEATIQKLKEYRQSIIYEAVTGKIEV